MAGTILLHLKHLVSSPQFRRFSLFTVFLTCLTFLPELLSNFRVELHDRLTGGISCFLSFLPSTGRGCIPTWNGQGCVFQHAMEGCQSGSRGVHPPGQTPPLTHTHTHPIRQLLGRRSPSLGRHPPAMVERDFTATSKVPRPNTKISIGQGMDSVSHLCVLLLLESKVNENKIISMMDYQVEFYKY